MISIHTLDGKRASLFGPGAATYLPHFAIGQFIFGYGVLSTRGPKVALGMLSGLRDISLRLSLFA